MVQKIALLYNEKKEESLEKVDILKRILSKKDVSFSDMTVDHETELIISVGGDGTVLKSAREAHRYDVPLSAVNTGTLGFLGLDIDDLESFVVNMLNDNYTVREMAMLQVIIDGEKINALNDVVVKNGDTARVINLTLTIDGKEVFDIKGDGIIIATPTGSTAYSLAAGGPVVTPDMDALTVTPLAPHSLSYRSLVTGDSEIIISRKSNGNQTVIVTADGQISRKTTKDTEISVSLSPRKLKLVGGDINFFKILKKKLKWG